MKRGKSKTTRQARKGASASTVAKTVLAGTLGISLMPVPVLAGASSAQIAGTTNAVVVTSTVHSNSAEDQSMGGNAKVTKEQAVQTMISLFPILKDYKLENASYSENENSDASGAAWMLNWSVTKGKSSYYFTTNVNAVTGEILNFNQPMNVSNEDSAYYPPEVSKEQAEKAAKDFIRKAAPSISVDNLVTTGNIYGSVKTLLGPVTYSFMYNLKVNGVPTDGEMINISVDGKGRIVSYDRNSYNQKYPSNQTSLSSSEATEAFKKDTSIQLAYVSNNDFYGLGNKSQKDWQLAYIIQPYLLSIDAKTGKKFNPDPAADETAPTDIKYTALPAAKQSFTPHTGQLLTSKEATQRFSDLVPSSKDYSMNAYLTNYWMNTDQQVWNINWNQKDNPMQGENISMNVDAATGQLLNYGRNLYTMSGSPNNKDDKSAAQTSAAISETKAREKAIELVEKYYPDADKVLKLSNQSDVVKSGGKTSFRYVFQRFYNNLPMYNHQVNVTLDSDGKLYSYYTNGVLAKGFEKELDALAAKITPEDAASKIKDGLGAELRYTRSGGYYLDLGFIEPKITLIYAPTFKGARDIPYLNAVTGDFQVYGIPVDNKQDGSVKLPADAISHSASKDLATLLEYDVISPDSDGLLHPDAELTYGDMIMMITKAVYPGQYYYDSGRIGTQFSDVPADSPYAQGVQMFAERGWFRNASGELHPQQKLTRSKLADMIVEILHYDRLAKFYDSAPEVMTLSDAASISNKGAVELVMKLGLMSTKDGKFEPGKVVTKAEAASFLVLLAHIQGKVDSPVTS
ncbi:S-layer homology domain-containing protein [Paenibacillus chibensis]|uniref:S-layer homology domain-containing protein n=1 Tax=Paenibacillus chibensis TaxID=59846 RepID=A0ABU6PQW7_9BACL|nr:S-layer homology domain-containing protein [Paenibacillus chibensis]